MYVVVIGAGEVGLHTTRIIETEFHDAVVIDSDAESLQKVEETFDVQTVQGNGASDTVLRKAGVNKADLVIAVTDNDEINMVASLVCKRLGAKKTIARVQNLDYWFKKRRFYQNVMRIDWVINTRILTARECVKLLRTPGSTAVEDFAGHRVQIKQIAIPETSRLIQKPLKDVKLPEECLITAIFRNGEIIIPGGNDFLEPKDNILVMGNPKSLGKVESFFGRPIKPYNNVAIISGSDLGYLIAKELERYNVNIKLFEEDAQLCEKLSEELPKTMVINGMGSDLNLLKEERIDKMDAVVSASKNDEENMVTSLLSKELGVKKTIALVQRPDFQMLYKKVGVDAAISPRLLTANSILKFIRRGNINSISILEGGKAEILELSVNYNSPIVNIPLIDAKLPKGLIIGAVIHNEDVEIARGNTVIQGDDTVITFVREHLKNEIDEIFFPKDD